MNSQIREALLPPTPQEVFCRQRPVFINHPGRDLPLLTFPAFSTGSTATSYGVSRPLVLDACRVLANHAAKNQEDFLAPDIQGRDRLEIDGTPLDVDCYYFLGAPELEANRDFPIVKTFSTFRCPSVLPDRWALIATRRPRSLLEYPRPLSPSQMPDRVRLRDRDCILTRCSEPTQCAHLVPKAHEAWFVANRMEVDHIGDPWTVTINIDHPANGILLRVDVRTCFDANAFVFYPADSAGEGGHVHDDEFMFMTYFVRGGYQYLRDVFHRRRVATPPDVPVEFLYARFAYAIVSMPRFDPAFQGVPELPDVEEIRGRIQRREQREREMMAYERSLAPLDGNGGGSGEDGET
ncbi:hypothetical protein V8D89_012811 [Ganoderma adspersum]